MTKPKAEPLNQLDDAEARWFAIRTRSKCEKMVRDALKYKQIEAYVPLQRTTKRYTRKIKHYDKPLITCYVFVHIVKKEYVPVLETENVAGFVRFDRNLLAIPDYEMEWLRRVVLEDGLTLEAIPGAFAAGDPIMVKAGPLAGMQGTIITIEGKRKVQVELQKMGYSLLLTIDNTFLEKVGDF